MHWSQSVARKSLTLCASSILMSSLVLPLLEPPAAQAGLFNFWGGSRGGGRASGRARGGAVRAGRTVGGTRSDIPYVITPRNTGIASDEFTIRWNPVAGATSYRVRLFRWSTTTGKPNLLLWETTVTNSQVAYAGKPALEFGPTYGIEVVASNGASSKADEGADKAKFELISPEDQEILKAELKDLKRADLEGTEYDLTLASIYFREDLLADAMDTLEASVQADPNQAVLHDALGEIYSYAGLNTLAQRNYRQAVTLAEAKGNLAEASFSTQGLAEVYATQQNISEALRLFQKAKEGYLSLNDERSVAAVQRRINLLQSL